MTKPRGTHIHRPINVNGQQVCQDCGEVQIHPILSFDDERLHGTATPEPVHDDNLWVEALKGLCPMRLDFMLIELSERTNHEWPDYIDKLADYMKGENPPHLNDPALGKVD